MSQCLAHDSHENCVFYPLARDVVSCDFVPPLGGASATIARPSVRSNSLYGFDIIVKADPSLKQGSYNLGCDGANGTPVIIYDATPQITSVEHYYGGDPTFDQTEGSVAVRIRGTILGSCGQISIAGPGVSVDTTAAGYCGPQRVTYWTSDHIDVYFNIDPNAIGQFTVTAMVSQGDAGLPFVPQPGGGSQNSGLGQMTVVSLSATVPRLWYFDGLEVGGSATSATLTLNGGPPGLYSWTVTNGADKVSFSPGFAPPVSTITTQQNSVPLFAIGRSGVARDVVITATWSGRSRTYFTEVDWPNNAALQNEPQPMPYSSYRECSFQGYISVYDYGMFSFFKTRLKNMPFNESFGDKRPADSSWPSPPAVSDTSSDLSTAGFFDRFGACQANPPSQPPGSGTTEVFQIDHSYRAASSTIGSGVLIQTDTVQYFLDHARPINIVSPVITPPTN